MKTTINYQINKNYILKKIKIDYYRNKMTDIKKFKGLHRSYIELRNKFKALDEKSHTQIEN